MYLSEEQKKAKECNWLRPNFFSAPGRKKQLFLASPCMPWAPVPHLSHSLPHRTSITSLVLYFPKKATSQPGPLLLQAAVCPLAKRKAVGWCGWRDFEVVCPISLIQGRTSYTPGSFCLLSLLAGLQTPQVINPILKRHSYNALGLPKAFNLLISKVR